MSVPAFSRLETLIGAGGSGAGTAPTTDGMNIVLNPGTDTQATRCDLQVADDGFIYVCAQARHVVLKYNPRTGQTSVFAGTWDSPGFSGDGGQATSAQLNYPAAISTDITLGQLLIADRDNNRVRSVSFSTGVITTFMGDGTAAYSGYGSTPPSAKIYKPIAIAKADNKVYIAGSYQNPNTSIIEVDYDSLGITVQRLVTQQADVMVGVGGEGVFYHHGVDPTIHRLHSNGTIEEGWFTGTGPISGLGSGGQAGPTLLCFYNSTGGPVAGSMLHRIGIASLPGAAVPLCGTNTESGGATSAMPADGSPIDIPFGTTTALPSSMFLDMSGVPITSDAGQPKITEDRGSGEFLFSWACYLIKFVTIVPNALTSYVNPVVVRTNTAGFSDALAVADILASVGSGSAVNPPSPFYPTHQTFLRNFSDNQVEWVVGSSYANSHYNSLEVDTQLISNFSRAMLGVRDLSFQTRGGGEGTLYGVDAPRLKVVNKTGTFLIERWLNGSTVNDYGVIIPFNINGGGPLIICAGIRDISTRGCAFVACLSGTSYSAIFAETNAVLVHVTYPDSVATPAAFTPTTSNCRVMKLTDVAGIHPIAP